VPESHLLRLKRNLIEGSEDPQGSLPPICQKPPTFLMDGWFGCEDVK